MNRLLVCLAAMALVAPPAKAQGPIVKYGKWLLVAGSIAMNYSAVRAHNRAEDNFHALESRCSLDPSRCTLNSRGSYVDAESEQLYQRTLQYDRAARRWLIGGETALAGAAALLVWELTQPKERPPNIPFEPEVRSLSSGTGLGLRINF